MVVDRSDQQPQAVGNIDTPTDKIHRKENWEFVHEQ
jgi:hypothetical protein